MIGRSLRRLAALAATAAVSAACSSILGLDQGVADSDGGSDDAALVDRAELPRESEPPMHFEAMAQDGLGPDDVWVEPLPDATEAASPPGDTSPRGDVATSLDATETTDAPAGADATAADAVAAEAGGYDASLDAVSTRDAPADAPADAPPRADAGCAHLACPAACCDAVPNGMAICDDNGACGHVCSQGFADCAGHPCSCGGGKVCLSNDTCGACLPTLAGCRLSKDCCSGNCTLSLTCL